MSHARPTSRSHAQAGFTLLELLLATAVGAVVLIAIQTTFFGALRLQQHTHERLDTTLALERTLGIVRRDLAGIMLPGGTLSGQLQTTSFSSLAGGSYGDRITPDLFTTSGRIDGWTPFSEAQMVAYYLAPASGGSAGRDLVRVVTRNLLPVQDTAPDQQTILQGVTGASLSFHDGAGWTDTWDSTVTSTLPEAFKLTLLMAVPESPAPPAPVELVVPVRVATTASQQEAEAEAAP